jgi:hypothetical protein
MKFKVFVRRAVLAAFVVTMLANGRQAAAQENETCLGCLWDCYGWAARQSGIWQIWIGGLSCEEGYIECFRQTLIGR